MCAYSTLRKAGILVHPTSFPSPYGIGDLGSEAYNFIDFLEKSEQKLWQVLPIGPTGYGDSPYQSFSSFAGQPLLIDLEDLQQLGFLTREDLTTLPDWDSYAIDYGPVITYKFSLLEKAFDNFKQQPNKSLQNEFTIFLEKNYFWLEDYALFMAAKIYHDGVAWTDWTKDIAFPTKKSKLKWQNKLKNSIKYHQFIQFIFFKQWFALKAYANDRSIEIIGDTPIFVAFDSADVWANKNLFYLDTKGFPTHVAGVPPDYFSETGQLWGNPLYNWPEHKKNNYAWWIKRLAYALTLVDFLRIDHFRGFEAYWAVPFGSPNAIKGTWEKGPFKDLFYSFEASLGKNLPIIAEDLGIITEAVEDLRDSFHLPGMKILQFAFEDSKDNNFLPHLHIPNSICYTGTHDNDTTVSWYKTIPEENKDKLRRYLNTDANNIAWDMIRACYGSVSNMAIVPLQDLLSFDAWARMNTPGSATGNWQWRYTSDMLTHTLQQHLLSITRLYGRSKGSL